MGFPPPQGLPVCVNQPEKALSKPPMRSHVHPAGWLWTVLEANQGLQLPGPRVQPQASWPGISGPWGWWPRLAAIIQGALVRGLVRHVPRCTSSTTAHTLLQLAECCMQDRYGSGRGSCPRSPQAPGPVVPLLPPVRTQGEWPGLSNRKELLPARSFLYRTSSLPGKAVGNGAANHSTRPS